MKGIAYTMLVICALVAFLSAVCLVNGKLIAVVPLVINVVAVIILANAVDKYESGDR